MLVVPAYNMASRRVTTWDPASIGDLSGRFHPSLGITEVSGAVSALANQTGGTPLTQATAGKRPVRVVGGGPAGQDAIDFTVDSFGKSLVADLGLGSAITVCLVAQVPAASRYLYDGSSADVRCLLRNAGQLRMFAGAYGPSITPPADGTWITNVSVFNNTGSKQTIDGGTAATGTTGAGTSSTLTLGARFGEASAQGSNVRMGLVLVYNRALSDADRALVEAHLAAWKAGAFA